MTLLASVGQSQALDGREAGLQATHKSLNRLGAGAPCLGIVIASHQYEAREVASGVTSLLGEVPIVGFSSPAGLTNNGQHPHSVVVALLSSTQVEAETHWLPGYAQSGRETASQLLQIATTEDSRGLLLFADGFNGDAEQMCTAIENPSIPIIGGLSSGDMHTGNTYQISGTQTGTSSLAAALLKGNIRIGIGHAHGWDPVGNQFRVTRSRGFWLRTLDGRPASETYAQLFGYPARDWAFPPLTYLVRLYPLGVEQEQGLLVRSPLRVEADGSFRMNATVRDGLDAYLLIGSPATCRKAAQQAAEEALNQLGKVKPAFALVLADIGWEMLLKGQPGLEIGAVQEVLGPKIPIAGGYTLGQFVPGEANQPPQFLNQHLVVMAFGEEE